MSARVAAQVACEYVVNYPHDGFDQATRLAVLDAALAADVAEFYVDEVAAQVQYVAMEADRG